jgi:cytidylate kinase
MKKRTRSIEQIIEEQVQKWQRLQVEKKDEIIGPTVITVSRQPGSGGKLIAGQVAEKLGFDLFDQEVIHEMAESAQVGTRLLETLDARGVSVLEDWISSLVNDRHLWPDEYLHHLLKVVGTIGKHGRAVIVGRGASFVLPTEKRFRVRIFASEQFRVNMVAKEFNLSKEEARRRVIRTDSDRKAFIRKYFNTDIAEAGNYDMLLNTETLSIEACVKAVCGVFGTC